MKSLSRVALSLTLTMLLLSALMGTIALAAQPSTSDNNSAVFSNPNTTNTLGDPIIINELDADQDSTDAAEFIELYDGGSGNASLTGMVLVLFNGSSDVSYRAYDLDGHSTNGNGYFVLCGDAANVPNCDLDVSPDTNLIQNGEDAAALFIGNDTDFPTGTAVTTTNLLDAIVYDTDDPDDPGLLILLNPGQPQVNEASNDSTIDSNQRCANGSGGPRNTDTYIQAPPSAGVANNCPTVDVAVTKSGPSVAQPGNTISYTILYENSGALDALAVVLTDTLPTSYISYLSDNSGLTCPACMPGATGSLTWTVGPLSSTDSFSFTLVAAITDTAPFDIALTNTLTISTSSSEVDTSNNSDQWVVNIDPIDLSVNKEGPAVAIIGGPLAYDITLQNIGVATATNVILTDALPLNTTYASDNSGLACPACTPGATGPLTYTVGNVAANSTISFTLVITVDGGVMAGTVLTNSVTAVTDATGDDDSNNSDLVETAVYPFVSIHDIQFVPDPATDDASTYEGQIVWTEGIITAQPGEIDTPSRHMIIQDAAGGPWSGLDVFRNNGFGNLTVPEGTSVQVLGQVTEFFGFTQLNLDNDPWAVQVLGTVMPLAPNVLTDTASFADADAAVSERWEGVLLEFQGSTVTDDNLGFSEWYHDDGSGPSRADDLGDRDNNLTYVATNGDLYQALRGIGWYSFGNYKLQPRYDADVILQLDEPLITKSAPSIVAPSELFTYTITVENLLGYDLSGVSIGDVVPSNSTFAYALDGGSTIVSNTDTLVSWMIPSLPNQTSVDVRFAVTATNVITQIVNEFYGIQAANYPTITQGTPLTTLVNLALRIHDIQGESHLSPYEGLALVDIPGIVTVVRSSSFYMQDPSPDSNDSTSEGITVFTGGSPGVNVGDFVLVSGQVTEFYPGGIGTGNLPTTQLSNPSIVISTTGNALPTATIIGMNGRTPPNSVIDDDGLGVFDPANDGIDFYESLEGMLVQVEDGLVVGSKRFGEIQIVADNGLNATGLNARGGLVISQSDFNPERIIIDDAIVFSEPFAEVGYAFTDIVTGVMDYSFGNFKLLNSAPLPPLTPGGLVSETATLVGTADQLTVASYNVLNLDPGDSTFAGLANTIVNNLNAPDIIGLQEIQDNNGSTNDGTTDASLTYSTLITAILNAGGPTYEFRDIAPANNMDGGQPGGNIRVGFLYQPARVTFVDRPGGDATTATTPQLGLSGVELTYSPGRIAPTNIAFTDSRKPLAGEFIFNNQKVFVAVNHFNSKGGDDPLFGATQPPILNSEVQRLQQAQAVHDFVADILAIDPNANVIVLGDLNDFQFSPPLATLQDGVLTNLMDTLPATEQYTFIFDGNSQILDHILASSSLATSAVVDVVHVNAEFDASHRASDHDPVLAQFELPLVPDVAPTAVSLTGPTTGFTNTTYTFNADVLPISTTLPLTFTWTADGQTDSSQLRLSLTDAISYSWATTGIKVISVTATNGFGSVTAVHTIVITQPIEPPPSYNLYLPFMAKDGTAAASQSNHIAHAMQNSQSRADRLLTTGIWWKARNH